VPGVVGVEPRPARDGVAALVIETTRESDVRAELVELVRQRGWRLLELHQVGLSLEEVFIRVVAGEEQAQLAAAAPVAADGAAPESTESI